MGRVGRWDEPPIVTLAWSPLWRAAQAWAAGARGPLLQLMGGWCTPSVAVSYATPTHAWEFESRCQQPVPVREGGELKVVFGEWLALQ